MEIVQIVPNLPPATDGLADFSLMVARELCDNHHQIHSHFVVDNPTWHGPDQIEPTEMQAIADRARAWYEKHSLARTAASLASVLRNKSAACNC
jgi:hypothetical protein